MELFLNAENLKQSGQRGWRMLKWKAGRNVFQRVVEILDTNDGLKRKILPILSSNQGKIILRSISANPYVDLSVFDQVINVVVEHSGLSTTIKENFMQSVLDNLVDSEKAKISSLQEKWSEQITKVKKDATAPSIFRAVDSGNSDDEIIDFLNSEFGTDNLNTKLLAKELLGSGFDEKRVQKLIKTIEAIQFVTEVPNFQQDFLHTDSIKLRAVKIYEFLLAHKEFKTINTVDSSFLMSLQDALNNLGRKESQGPMSEHKILNEIKVMSSRFEWMNQEAAHLLAKVFKKSFQVKVQELENESLIFSEEQKFEHKERLKEKLVHKKSITSRDLILTLRRYSIDFDIPEMDLLSAFYDSLIDDRAYTRLKELLPAKSFNEVLSKLLTLQESGELFDDELANSIKRQFESLTNAEMDEIRDAVEDKRAAELLLPEVKLGLQVFDHQIEKDDNNEGQVEFRMLQHWLIATEEFFKEWTLAQKFEQQIILSINEFAKSQNVNRQVFTTQLLDILKTRSELSSFENELMNVVLKEANQHLLKSDVESGKQELDSKSS